MLTPTHTQHGMNLVELMVAITLGLLIVIGMTSVFMNSSNAQREFDRSVQQVENGRFAMQSLIDDLHHAGFYGEFFPPRKDPAPAVLPDPCMTTNAGNAMYDALYFPMQGYRAPDEVTIPGIAFNCGGKLVAANLKPGSDILVIRRADTERLVVGAQSVVGEVYIQGNSTKAELQFGTGAVLGTATKVDGTPATIFARDGVTAADTRKLRAHVYFVAPCRTPAGGGDVCTGTSDDGGNPIPTLKRLELVAQAGALAMQVVTVADGVEFLRLDYGIDNSPNSVNLYTQFEGDGAPDVFSTVPTAGQFPQVVSVQASLLARNLERTGGYSDAKTYTLGSAGPIGPFADAFKRHVFSATVRLVNMSGRRENPI
jgi:type IV pilus assembly protein PilW